jgi:hypothetical protein
VKLSRSLQWALTIGACLVYLPTAVVGVGYGAMLVFDTRGLLDGGRTPWWMHLWGSGGVLLLLWLVAQGAQRKTRGEKVVVWNPQDKQF